MPRLGVRAAARAAGVMHSYVSRLVKDRSLARGEDGLVDVDELRAVLAKSDPAQRRKPSSVVGHSTGHHPVTPSKRSPAAVTTPTEAREAVALIVRVLAEEGVVQNGTTDLPAARLAETILKARDRDLRIAERRRKLVPLDAVQAHFSKIIIGIRREIERMPDRHSAEMAAQLGCDAGALDEAIRRMIHATLTEMSEPAPPG